MRALSLLAALVLYACSGGGNGSSTGPLNGHNLITVENARPGDPDWRSGKPARGADLEAYADRSTARAGDAVGVKASASSPSAVDWALYRMGWYGGAGARAVASGSGVQVSSQPRCPVQPGTGLVACAWPDAFVIAVPTDAVSGLYVIKLARADGVYTFVPLVVHDDRAARLLFQASITTWQAYNLWGGTSLYVDTVHATPFRRGVAVSFDRPYSTPGFDRPWEPDEGAGQLLHFEVHFARFLEKYGYDVSYTTNALVSRGDLSRLQKGQAFLSVGHDEYWTLEERDAIEAARDRGVSTLFFGANTGYWKIRFADEARAGDPRTLISYKADAAKDPETGPDRTGLWRGPIGRPENELLGVMYESWERISGPWVVSDSSHFLYEGTGLRNGDAIPSLVGYEYDRTYDNGKQPAGLRVMSRSPVLDVSGIPGFSEAASYRAPSAALVFSSGTIEWSYGLGKEGIADPRVERMTANVIREATGIPVPKGVGAGAPSPPPKRDGTPASSVETAAKELGSPSGVTVTQMGMIVFADPRAHRIFEIGSDGAAHPLAGDGVPSSDPAFDDTWGSKARFNGPTAVVATGTCDAGGVLAGSKALYIADTGNHCIRVIGGGSNVQVGTIAGAMGAPGMQDGPWKQSRFNLPMGLAIEPRSGDLLVADAGNGLIRRVTPSGTTSTFAGGGSSPADGPARDTAFSFPTAVAAAPDGTVYVVDTGYGTVRRVATDGTVTTLVRGPPGSGDGSGDVARLSPQGGAAWLDGALYVSEPATLRIRRIVPGADAASTRVETLAGGGFGSKDGRGDEARFGLPVGLFAATDGTLYVADAANGAIRRIRP